MLIKRTLIVTLLILGATLMGAKSPAIRADMNKAALVVEFSGGFRVVRVVQFAEPSISGLDLAALSGLDVSLVDARICKIGPDGCTLPTQDCWCNAPYFWNYFYWTGYRWDFSCAGPSTRRVTNGNIEYLYWSNGLSPDPMDTSALFDETRLAPGLPNATTDASATLHLTVRVAGDTNGNGQVSARYRRVGGAWGPWTALVRTQNLCLLDIAALQPGPYQVEVQFSDPDGVRGSTTWQTTVQVPLPQSARAYFPDVRQKCK